MNFPLLQLISLSILTLFPLRDAMNQARIKFSNFLLRIACYCDAWLIDVLNASPHNISNNNNNIIKI